MEIYTKRCKIRCFTEKDIDGFIAYRNNKEWMKYQGFKGLTKDEYRNELLADKPLSEGKQFAVINKAADTLIGDVYLIQKQDTFWLGYSINPIYSRQGYMLEVIPAVISWINQQGFADIKAGVLPENTASVNLLKKLGFYFDGESIDGEYIYTFKSDNKSAAGGELC